MVIFKIYFMFFNFINLPKSRDIVRGDSSISKFILLYKTLSLTLTFNGSDCSLVLRGVMFCFQVHMLDG